MNEIFWYVLDCSEQYFQCSSLRTCIPKALLCDGNANCARGEDEIGCVGKFLIIYFIELFAKLLLDYVVIGYTGK